MYFLLKTNFLKAYFGNCFILLCYSSLEINLNHDVFFLFIL